jgi:hypothetical protein
MVVLSAICLDDYYQCSECKSVSQTAKNAAGPVMPFGTPGIQRS